MNPQANPAAVKTAIVTGGGSGINFAFTKLLLASGYSVLIADLNLRPDARDELNAISRFLPSTAHEHDTQTRGQAHFLQTDVTDWSQLERTFTECKARFGRGPDVVVPGAGVYEPSSNSFWQDRDVNGRYRVLDINLVHPIKMTRLAIRHMLEEQVNGTIVHVSSIAGQRSSLVTPLYQASKHGINSFVRGMAPLQDAAGVRVVGVAPGTVATPLFTDHPEAAQFLDPEQDFMLPPDEVARAMMALVTERDKYKAGTIIEVCDVEGRWREVSLLNDPGPSGPASKTSRKGLAAHEVWKLLGIEGDVAEGQAEVRND